MAPPGFGAYCAAKFALEGFSEALADEVAPLGIQVLLVEPGAFRTNLGGHGLHRAPIIDDYVQSTAQTRANVEEISRQPGDPAKAAAVILNAVSSPQAPLRLALGPDAVESITAKHDRLRCDLEAWKAVSVATGIDTVLTA